MAWRDVRRRSRRLRAAGGVPTSASCYSSSGVREEIFRARADWYIPMSIAAFLAVVVLVEVLANRADARRTAALHEQHMAEVRRDLGAVAVATAAEPGDGAPRAAVGSATLRPWLRGCSG